MEHDYSYLIQQNILKNFRLWQINTSINLTEQQIGFSVKVLVLEFLFSRNARV